ncbi:MAG TPA: hypothetical protein VJI33_04475 [Candidatus Paceibacterota bacterium]
MSVIINCIGLLVLVGASTLFLISTSYLIICNTAVGLVKATPAEKRKAWIRIQTMTGGGDWANVYGCMFFLAIISFIAGLASLFAISYQ